MFSKRFKKVSIAFVSVMMIITSLPHIAKATGNIDENLDKITIKLEKEQDIFVGDEFNIKVMNFNVDDKTILEVPEGLSYIDQKDEQVTYDAEGRKITIPSASERIIRLKADTLGDFKLKYTNLDGSIKDEFRVITKELPVAEVEKPKLDQVDQTKENEKEVTKEEEESKDKEQNLNDNKNGTKSESLNLAQLQDSTDKKLTVDIESFTSGQTWSSGETKKVSISADFNDSITDGKRIEIELPEGMKYVEYGVKGNPRPNSPEYQLAGISNDFLLSSFAPNANEFYKSFNGNLTYNVKKDVPKYEIVIYIAVDDKVFYGNKDIQNALQVSAKMGDNTSIGKVSFNVAATGRNDSYIYDVRDENNRKFMYKDNTTNTMPRAYLANNPSYIKTYTLHYFVPIGTENIKIDGKNTDFTYNKETGEIVRAVKNIAWTGDIFLGDITANISKLEQKTYNLDKIFYELEYYDGTKITKYSSKENIVEIVKAGENSSDINTRAFQIARFEDLDYPKAVSYSVGASNSQKYTNQMFEITIDPNYDAKIIVLPKAISNEDIDVEITTNRDKNNTIKAKAKKDKTYFNDSFYYITKDELGISESDQIATVKAYLGELKNPAPETVSPKSPGIYGNSLDMSKKNVVFSFKSYGPKLDDSGEYEKGKSVTVNVPQYQDYKSKQIESRAMIKNSQFETKGGESKQYSFDIFKDNPNYDLNTTILKRPSIIMKIPEGIDSYSNVKVIKKYQSGPTNEIKSKEIATTISASYVKNGTNYIKIDILDDLGYINSEEFGMSFNISFVINSSKSANINTTTDELFWITSDQNLASHLGVSSLNNDDKANSGDLSQKLLNLEKKQFLITPSSELLIDTYIVPKGGEKQPPYDYDRPDTAIGYTPNSEGDFTVNVKNQTNSSASKFVMYIPVPKDGVNFGDGFQINQPFNWDMKLQGNATIVITGPNGEDWTASKKSNYEIGYSSTVSNEHDFAEDEDLATSSKYGNLANDDVRMIRVRNIKGIDVGEKVEIKFNYIAKETPASAVNKIGKINDFNPRAWVVAGSTGWTTGTRVGVVLQMGTINGTVFEDKNGNGQFDSNEALANRTITAKNLKSGTVVTTKTNAQGAYEFKDLSVTDYELDFNGALGANEKFSITGDGDNGSKVPYKGNNVGKLVLKPTDSNAKHINAGIIKYSDNGFDGNISMANLQLKEPTADGTLNANSKKENKLTFTDENIKKYIDGKVRYSVEKPDLVSVKEVEDDNFTIEVTAKRGVVAGTTAKTKITATFTDIYGRSTSTTFTVDIASNNPPVISLTGDYVELVKGTEYNINLDNNVTIADPEETITKDKISINKDHLDKSKVGIQSVIYTVTDSDGNVSSPVTRKVVVTDDDNKIKDGHLIRMTKEYAIDIKDYPNSPEKKEEEALSENGGNVLVTRISDGSNIKPDFNFDLYKKAYGDQSYYFTVKNTTIKETITVKVSDKHVETDEYNLYARNAYISRTDAAKIVSDNNLATKSVELMKPFGELKTNGTKKNLEFVSVTPAFDGKVGKFDVTFAIPGDAKQKITATLNVLDYDHVLQSDEHVIAANDFKIGKKDIKDGILNFNARSKSILFNVTDPETNLGVEDTATTLVVDGAKEQTVVLKSKDAALASKLKLDVKATLEDGQVVDGDKYVLVLPEEVELQKYEARQYIDEGHGTTNAIIAKVGAKSYLKTDMTKEAGTIEYKAHTFTDAVNGTATFAVKEESNGASGSVNIKIKTDTAKPVVTIEEGKQTVKLNIGDSFNYKDGVSAQDIDNPSNPITFDNGKLVADITTIDTSVRGVYVITYTATDKNNVVSDPKVKIVTVGEKDIPVVGQYYIVATNIMEKTSDYTSNDADNKEKLIEDMDAYAVHTVTGARKKVVVSDLNGFTNKSGTYTINLKVEGIDSADSLKTFAALTNGDIARSGKYFLTAQDKTGGTNLATTIIADTTNNELFKAMDVRAIPKYGSTPVAINEITVTDKITEAVKQEKQISFKVLNDDATKLTKKLTITKDGDGDIDDGIYLGASNFVIGRDNIAKMSDADYLEYSGANARKVDPVKELTVEVKQKLVAYGAAEQEVTFKVVNEDREIKVRVKVVEGKTVLGDDYVISGKDFTITGAEAKDLKANPADKAKDSILINHADANLKSYKRFSLSEAGSVVVEDRANIDNVAGDYETTYRVSNGTTTQTKPEIKLMVHVDMGTAPTLSFKKVSTLAVGSTFKPADQFISGSAKNDGKNALSFADIDQSLTVGTVNKDVVGIYPVTFKYIDSYGLEATATHLVAVTDGSVDVTEKNVIYGQNVMMTIEDAKADAKGNIKTKSKAYAYNIETGKKVADDKISIELGDFKEEIGKYKSKIKIDGDDQAKEIRVVVSDGEVIDNGDYLISASPKTVIGKKLARDIVADTSNVKLLSTMNVVALHKTLSDEIGADKIKVEDKITNDNEIKANIKFSVIANANAKTTGILEVTKDEDVVDNDGIILGANPFVIGRNNIASMELEDYLAYSGANAKLESDGSKVDVNTLTTLDDSLTAPTKQQVEFKASKGDKSATIKVDVQILEGYTKLGDKYVLSGRDFDITGKQAKDLVEHPNDATKDLILIENTGARLASYRKFSLDKEGTVVVSDRSEIKNEQTESGYKTKYKVKNTAGTIETSPELELLVNVTMGEAPTIVTHKTSQIGIGETFDAKSQFVSGTALNDEKASLKFEDLTVKQLDTIDNTKVGVYRVEYSYTDSYDLTAKAIHLVIVNDGSVHQTEHHIIYGENVALKVDQVNSTVESTLKSKTNAYAYVIETGKKVDDDKISVKKGDVKAEEGLYTAQIAVDGDPDTKPIKVMVSKDAPNEGEQFIISARDTKISRDEAKLEKATLDSTLIKKSGATAIAKTSLDPVQVLVQHTINDTVGNYDAKYYVNKVGTTTMDANITKNVEVVKDKDIDNDKDLYVSANDFIVAKDKVSKLADADYVALAKAEAKHESDTSNIYTPYVEGDKLNADVTTAQNVEFRVKKNNDKLAKPSVVVQALVIDGDVIDGDTHTITGKPFSITGAQASMIKDSENNEHDDILILGGEVTSYLKNTLVKDGDVYVKDKSQIKPEDGTYKVEFGVKVNGVVSSGAVIKLDVKVNMSEKPTLDIITSSKVSQGGEFKAETQFISGHDFSANKDLTFADIKVDQSDLDLTTEGIYKVIYSYTDTSDQKVSKVHNVAVGNIDEVGDYFIYAENAFLKLNDIRGKSETELNTMTRAQVKPKAVHKTTGKELEDSKISITGYSDVKEKVGDYPLTIKLEGETQTAGVKLFVRNGNITPGKNYVLITNGTTVTTKEVKLPALDTLVINRSGTEAIHKTSGVNGTVSVDVSAIAPVVKENDVTYKVVEEAGLEHAEKVKVTDDGGVVEDDDVYISASSFVVGSEEVASYNNDTTFEKYIDAAEAKAWSEGNVPGPFTIKVTEESKLKPIKGQQTVVYYVKEYPKVKISVVVDVTEGDSKKGDKYTITGKDMIISAADALEIKNGSTDKTNKIFGADFANIQVFENKSVTLVDKAVTFDKGTLNNKAGNYKVSFKVDEDPKATLELNVKVSQGEMPTLTIGKTQTVNIKFPNTYDELYQVQLTDNNGGGILTLDPVYKEEDFTDVGGKILIDKSELDLTKEGIYVVNYKAKDNNFNVVTGSQVVTVSKDGIPLVDDYYIYADNVVLSYHDDVKGKNDAQIIEKILEETHGYAVNVNDHTRKAITIAKLGEGFVKDEATNTVEVSVPGTNAKTNIQVKITRGNIVNGDNYILSYKEAYTTVKDLQPMTKPQIKAHVINKADAVATPKRGVVNGTVAFDEEVKAIKDTYKVKYYVVEEPTTKVKEDAKVIVKDKDVIIEKDDFVISADNFAIGLLDIDTFTDSKYIQVARAEVENRRTNEISLPTLGNRPAKEKGLQPVTFKSNKAEGLEATVNADVMDGNVVVKDDYIIKAEPVEISVEEALSVINDIKNGDDTSIMALAKVEAYKRKDKVKVDASMIEDSSTIEAKNGVYSVGFKVNEFEDAKITVKVTVSNGVEPTLIVPQKIVVKINSASFDKYEGVSAYDNNKHEAIDNSKITVTGDVDLSVSKDYVLEYEVTDANLNTVTAKTTVVVDDGSAEIIDNYVVRAKNFTINIEDVNTGSGANTQILEKSEASAHNLETHKDVPASDMRVVNNKGYKKAVAKYEDIEIGIKNVNLAKKITATVTEDDVVNGDLYTITSKATTVGQLDAKRMTENLLIKKLNVKVEKRVKDASVPEGTAVVENFDEFSKVPGKYTMKFKVEQEPATKTSEKITVSDRDEVIIDGAYKIAANNFIIGLEDLATITPQGLVDKAQAYATRTIGDDEVTVPVRWESGPEKVVGDNKPVVFSIVEKPTVKITTHATVKEGNVVEDEEFYITSHSVSIPISDLILIQNGTKDIYDIMGVNVYKKGESTPLGTQKTRTDISALEAKKATYDITFYFTGKDGKDHEVTSKMKLNEGHAPIVTVDKVQNIDLTKNASYDDRLGLTYSDEEDDINPDAPELKLTITGNDVVRERIKDKKASVVTVRYDVQDFDGNISTAYQTVVINDGSIIIGEDYALEAESFVIKSESVVAGEEQLIEKSKAKAYKLGTANVMGTVSAKSDDYSSEPGEYKVNLHVDEEPSTKKDIIAVVTKDDIIDGDEYLITAAPGFLGTEDSKKVTNDKLIDLTNAKAMNKKSGEVSDVKVVSHNVKAEPGTYKVTFEAVKEKETQITATVKVLNSKYVVSNGEYVLAADDFRVGKDDIRDGISNDQYVSLAKAYAFNRYAETTAYDVEMDETTAPVDKDTIVNYRVVNSKDTSVGVKATVLDGYVIDGDKYYLNAQDADIFVSEAYKVLQGEISLTKLMKATAYSKDGKPGTVEIESSTLEAKHGEFNVTLRVKEEPTTRHTFKVKVDKGNAPLLKLPEYTEIKVGDKFDSMKDVSAVDDRDTNLTKLIKVIGQVDVNKVGIYELEYNVTDSDFNTTSAKTYVVVNDGSIIIKDQYIIDAQNFMINKDDVDTKDSAIIGVTSAKAYNIKTKLPVEVVVSDKGGYKDTVGDYAIQLAVKVKPEVNIKVKAIVVDGDVIDGDDYFLSASDITIGRKDAKVISDQEIIDRASAKAIHKRLGTSGTVAISQKTLEAKAGNYEATYVVKEDKKASLTKNIKVLDKDKVIEIDDYVISANDFMVGDKFVKEMTKEQIVKLADAQAYNKKKPDVPVAVTQLEDIVTSVGKHNVTFVVEEYPRAKVQVEKTIFKDTMYYIEAKDAELSIADLTKSLNSGTIDGTILKITDAKGYKVKEDGSKEEMQVYITSKDQLVHAKAGTKADVTLSLVNPVDPKASASKSNASSYKIEEANVSATVLVGEGKDNGNNGNNNGGTTGGKKVPSTGVQSDTYAFAALALSLSGLIIVIIARKKRKEEN